MDGREADLEAASGAANGRLLMQLGRLRAWKEVEARHTRNRMLSAFVAGYVCGLIFCLLIFEI